MSNPTRHILSDARAECLRMAAKAVSPITKDTQYIRARHSDIGDLLLSIPFLKENDDVLIFVPVVDKIQQAKVKEALVIFHKMKVNYFWYYGPNWFDIDNSVSKTVDEVQRTPEAKKALKTISAKIEVNEFYTNTRTNKSDLLSYIDYRLMYFFMGVDSAETTLKTIITDLVNIGEPAFIFPSNDKIRAEQEQKTKINPAKVSKEEAFKFLSSIKKPTELYAKINPSMAGRTQYFEQQKRTVLELAMSHENVLVIGDSGTGKAAAAYYLHEFDKQRRGNKFLRRNCSAFSDELLASELFGHVEGAFTGSKRGPKVGLIEEADGGTIFLDEIPDACPRFRSMLLCFLETGEYSPVGSTETKTVNVKIVAGAQPELLDNLRSDFQNRFKKLNLLSLKELNNLHQPGDGLPDVVSMARNLAASCIGAAKVVPGIPGYDLLEEQVLHADIVRFWSEIEQPKIVKLLTDYDWPGNVRELYNCVSNNLCFGIPLLDCIPQNKNKLLTVFQKVNDSNLSGYLSKSSLHNSVVTEQCSQDSETRVSTEIKSEFLTFAPIKSIDDLIPYYEPENMYLELVRESLKNGCLKEIEQKKVMEKLGYKHPKTYKTYIIEGKQKQERTRG